MQRLFRRSALSTRIPRTPFYTADKRWFARDRSQPPNVAVVLSGCGVYDGTEITESVSVLVSLSPRASIQCFAPNIDQMHVVNHLDGSEMQETRNVLVESARIGRGNVKDIKELNSSDFDAVVFPGGFGAAKNGLFHFI